MGNSKLQYNPKSKTEKIPKTLSFDSPTTQNRKSTEALYTVPSIFKQYKLDQIRTITNESWMEDQDQEAQTAKVSNKPKTNEDKLLIKKSLLAHFLFTHLPEENIDQIIGEMKFYELEPKQIIFRQGDPGFNFFVLASGSVEVVINGLSKGTMLPGKGFGELALIHDSKRTATIKTVDKVQMWGLGRKVFRYALKMMSSLNFEENKKFLLSVPFLKVLGELQIEALVALTVSQTFASGQKIVVEGDPGELFYIIKEGLVECSCSGKTMRVLYPGEYFGEQALLYNTLRTATVTAVRRVKVLCLGREMLRIVLGDLLQHSLYKNSLRIAFDKEPCLQGLSPAQLEKIIDNVDIFSYKNEEVVVPEGMIKNKYVWIVLKGSIYSGKKTLNLFDNVGASWIYHEKNGLISSNLVALYDVDIGVISKNRLEQIIDGQLADVIEQNRIIEILKSVHLFRTLPESKLRLMAKCVSQEEYEQGSGVFEQGEAADKFFIVKEGEVSVVRDGSVIRKVAKSSFFGERSIILNETRTASVVCDTRCTFWVLSRSDFFDIVDESVHGLLVQRIKLQDDSIALNDLVLINMLGKGTFGNVFLCANKLNKELYALKSVSRKKIICHRLHESLNLERKILLSIEHQFIVKLVKTFKDDKRIYFLLEYVQGLCLHDVLRILNLLNTPGSRFYCSCLLSILEHLHANSIIYRDLKPENLMVDEFGYLKLLDFGTAKVIKNRTFTVVGTPQYMAPEIILGKGYSFAADLWSLGIILFEFICGAVPFGETENGEPYLVYKQIISEKFTYPKFIKSIRSERQVIDLLLSKVPSMRGTLAQLKQHKWFSSMDFEDLLSRKLTPPYVPNIDSLDKQIKFGIKQNQTLQQYFDTQDSGEPAPQRISTKPLPPVWDQEF